MGKKKKAKINTLLTSNAYSKVMKTYVHLKQEHNIDILLFFKSFVYQCSRTNNTEFNSYLVSSDLHRDIVTYYYPTYKSNGHHMTLYTTPMNGIFIQ